MAVNPQPSTDAAPHNRSARGEEATDRPAEDRSAHRTHSVSPGTLDPDPNTPRPAGETLHAEIYRPSTPWALFAQLAALYVAVTVITTTSLVSGWWFMIGPTDDTPTPPETIVRVERVEVPVPGPAPAPEVIYVQVPAPPAPPAPAVAAKKRVAPPTEVAVVAKVPDPVVPTVLPKVVEVAAPKDPPPVKAAPVIPAAAAALDGAYVGKAGTATSTFDLSFQADRVVRAVVTLNQDGQVSTHTVTGQYDLASDGSASIALFLADTAYTAIVSGGALEGRMSQGGKNKGKVSGRR